MNSLQEHQKGILAVFVAALMWSTGGIFIKLVTFDAMQISFFRGVFAAIVFIIIFKKNVIYANGFTFINAAFYSAILILFVIATKLTTAANAIFLQYTAPIYVLIFEPLINKTKYEKINVITILVCFIGMTLFFMTRLSVGYRDGNIIALLSGVAYAAFLLGMRKNKKEYQFSSIFYGNILVALICLPSIFSIQNFTLNNFLMVSYLGIFQIGIAYAIFSYGLKKVYAIEASLISMIEPVLNPLWVFLGYGEVPSFMAIIGGIIIISAISVRTFIFESFSLKKRLNKNE
ncbi:MAG TPA: EamA family transporter [Ignavibacteriaceae bacterium]|nr:EamA family transporter [Ignavibacteriaceae bacterium]